MENRMNLLRSKVYEIINRNEGKLFSCTFIKKDGSSRDMLCRTAVKKYLTGGELRYDPIEKGLLPVWEVVAGASESEKERSYRMISIDTMQTLRIEGQEFKIVDTIPNDPFSRSTFEQKAEIEQSIGKAA